MTPERGKGKRQPKKFWEDPKDGGGGTHVKDTIEEGGITPVEDMNEGGETRSVENLDEYHDAREEGEKNEEERNQNKEKGGEEEESSKENENMDDESEARDTAVDDSEELLERMQPLKIYFDKSEYGKPVKIITRCYNYKAVENLEKIPNLEELRWFKEHPQFAHFFHMPRDTNHKSMSMWMLLLRTTSIEKKKEAWYVVNGVPLRHSMRKHALLSGLNCKEYPSNYKEFGNSLFVLKHFD